MYWPKHRDYLGAPEKMYVDNFDCLFDIALDHYFTTTVCFDLGLPEELYLISAVCSIWYCRRCRTKTLRMSYFLHLISHSSTVKCRSVAW